MAKQSFQNDRLGRNPYGLASTGFNLNREALIDTSKVASSSKYGKSEIQRAHPGWNVRKVIYRLTGSPQRMIPLKRPMHYSILLTAKPTSGPRLRSQRPKQVDLQLIIPTLMVRVGTRIQF